VGGSVGHGDGRGQENGMLNSHAVMMFVMR